MTRIFSGPLSVHYAQAYLLPAGSGTPGLKECFRGQVNGLCGAALPGKLFLITGLHTGHVGFAVDLLDSPPLLDDTWEEVVEVPLSVTTSETALVEWAASATYPIPLPRGSFRARYCARGMQLGKDLDTSSPDGNPVDSYSLIFWPAQTIGDSVLRVTSEIAVYFHQKARTLH